jgi:hypothetical protein
MAALAALLVVQRDPLLPERSGFGKPRPHGSLSVIVLDLLSAQVEPGPQRQLIIEQNHLRRLERIADLGHIVGTAALEMRHQIFECVDRLQPIGHGAH